MSRKLLTIMLAAALGFGCCFMAGCENDAKTGALIGTAIGVAAGQVLGGDTKSTLIGAGIGAGAGYIIGNEQDKKK